MKVVRRGHRLAHVAATGQLLEFLRAVQEMHVRQWRLLSFLLSPPIISVECSLQNFVHVEGVVYFALAQPTYFATRILGVLHRRRDSSLFCSSDAIPRAFAVSWTSK